jgi:hypothetical protein
MRLQEEEVAVLDIWKRPERKKLIYPEDQRTKEQRTRPDRLGNPRGHYDNTSR